MEWNSLKASDKSRIIRTAVEHGITDLEEIKSFWNDNIGNNQYDDGGILTPDNAQSPDNPPMGRANPEGWEAYMEWAYAASTRLSKEWNEPESFIFFDMLNNNDYDYKAFYDEDPERAWQWLESPEGSHFDDVGKTVYHPSFSNESMYSANNYGDMGTGANPDNIEGPAWNDNNQLIDKEGNVVFDENQYPLGGNMFISSSSDDPPIVKTAAKYENEAKKFLNTWGVSDETIQNDPVMQKLVTRYALSSTAKDMGKDPQFMQKAIDYVHNTPYKPGKNASETPENPAVNYDLLWNSNVNIGNNRKMNRSNMEQLDNYFISKGVPLYQRQALLYTILQESGADSLGAHNNGYYGLVGWSAPRYNAIKDKSLLGQAEYLYNTLYNGNGTSDWNHGGKGTGYNSWEDAQKAFIEAQDFNTAMHALTHGYVRPAADVRAYRIANGPKHFDRGGSFRKYKKESKRIAEEYGVLGTQEDLTKRQYRRNKESLWQGLQQTENMYRNLYNSPLMIPDLQQRMESYSEGNGIPLDYNANPYNTLRQAQIQSALDNERWYQNQLTPEQMFENRIAARPDYRKLAELENEIAMFPTWFMGGETLGTAAEALSRKTSTEALRRLDNVQYIRNLNKPSLVEQIKDNAKFIDKTNNVYGYNYDRIPKRYALNTSKTNRAVKDIMMQDNTFLRGVRDVDDAALDRKINNYLGRNELVTVTPDERLEYLATHYLGDTGHGKAGMYDLPQLSGSKYGTIYTSNSLDTGAGYADIAGSMRQMENETDGKIAVVRRPLKFVDNRWKWFDDNNWNVFKVGVHDGKNMKPQYASVIGKTPGRQLKEKFFNTNFVVPKEPVINTRITPENIAFSTEMGLNNYSEAMKAINSRPARTAMGRNQKKFAEETLKRNMYNHYIFVGPEGEKGLDFVKFIEPADIKNITRSHTGRYTKGMSRKPTINDPFPYSNQ